MPNVLIFRSELLAISETFILAQVGALRRFTPRFAGLQRLNPSLPIPESAIVAGKHRARLYKEFAFAGDFYRQIRNADVCLVHAHFAVDGVFALPIARKLNIPLLVTLHGYDVTVCDSVWAKSRTGRLYLQRRRKMWEQAVAFLCVSRFIRGCALKAGFPEAKLRTHYIGVDRSEFPLGFVGSSRDCPVCRQAGGEEGVRRVDSCDAQRAEKRFSSRADDRWGRTHAQHARGPGEAPWGALSLHRVCVFNGGKAIYPVSLGSVCSEPYGSEW